MKKGWFIGDFDPSVYRTSKFEVGFHRYSKGCKTIDHFHEKSTEINVVISGRMIVNGEVAKKDDIFIFDPNVVSRTEFLEDTELIVVRTASVPNDKVVI